MAVCLAYAARALLTYLSVETSFYSSTISCFGAGGDYLGESWRNQELSSRKDTHTHTHTQGWRETCRRSHLCNCFDLYRLMGEQTVSKQPAQPGLSSFWFYSRGKKMRGNSSTLLLDWTKNVFRSCDAQRRKKWSSRRRTVKETGSPHA